MNSDIIMPANPKIIVNPKEWEPNVEFEDLLKDLGNIDELNEEQLKRLSQVKIDIQRRRQQSPIYFYKPYESRLYPGKCPQLEFHKSHKKIRLFIGGNRSGKSEGGNSELIWAALGIHPYYKYPVPGEYWVVSLDFPTSRDVAEQKFFKWMPKNDIQRWDKLERICYLKNGSKVGFRSCDQDINKFGGSAKDGIWFDEEPPGERGYQIYKECLMRTLDRQGRIWFTLTPVQGMSWTADELYEPARLGDPNKFEIEVSTLENPHISEAEIKIITAQLSEDEKLMRLSGKYIQFAGLVYKEFSAATHIVKPFDVPKHWKRFRTIDHGINNPTACLWAAVSPDDDIYIYDEYYETDRLVRDNAEAIVSITGGDKIEWTTIDPSTDNRDPLNGLSVRKEYFKYGIPTKLGINDKSPGIAALKKLLFVNPETKRPKLFFFENCYNTLKEISRYKWKLYRGQEDKNKSEEPQKVLDHTMDALRYLVMSRPRFNIYEEDDTSERPAWYV